MENRAFISLTYTQQTKQQNYQSLFTAVSFFAKKQYETPREKRVHRRKHCPLFGAKTAPAGRARRENYPLSLQTYCDVPSLQKDKLLVELERKKIALFSDVTCFASVCFNVL